MNDITVTDIIASDIVASDHIVYEDGDYAFSAVVESVRRTESYGQDVVTVISRSERLGCDVEWEIPADAKVQRWI